MTKSKITISIPFLICFFFIGTLQAKNAGVVPIATHEGKIYVLFGQRNVKNGYGFWGDFGGKQDKGEQSSSETASRELYEETGTWKISAEELTKNYRILIDRNKKYDMFLYDVPYIPAVEVYRNAKEYANKHNKGKLEVKHFDWVNVDDLANALKSKKQTISSQTGEKITLWDPTYKSLKGTYDQLGHQKFLNGIKG